MAGRNAKPISLHMAGGNPSHLTKAEIEFREKAEIKTGDKKLMCPSFVKQDVAAYKKWREVLKVYKDVDFVSSGDAGLLGRYCMSFSEYESLLEDKRKLNNVEINWDDYSYVLPEDFTESVGRLLRLDPLLKIDTAINKKMDMLIKMEDRLFLNPLAKVKNIPKKSEEESKENKFSKFQKGVG